MKKQTWRVAAVALMAAGLLGACDAGTDAGADVVAAAENLDAEACEHFGAGPFVDVTATDGTGAPDVSTGHTVYRIALTDVAGGKGGSVSYAVAHGGDVTVFLTADVPVTVTGPDGKAVAATASTKGSATCDSLAATHVFPLGVGTVTITFGPTAAGTVSAVLEAGGSEG